MISEQVEKVNEFMKKAFTKKQKEDFKERLQNKEEVNDHITLQDYVNEACRSMRNKVIKPKTKENHVGVELEFIGPKENYVDIMMALLNKGLTDNVVLGYDGSIDVDDFDEQEGYEIRILGTEKTILSNVKKVLNILSWHDCFVNETCGFHVHLDARHRNKNIMYDKIYNLKHLLYNMVDYEREYNSYCYKPEDRYYGTGGHSRGIEISDMNTVEVRLHHGTLDFKEVSNWIKLLLKIIKTPVKYNKDIWEDEYAVPKFVGPRLAKYAKDQMKRYAA